MKVSLLMDAINDATAAKPSSPRFVKINIPNLVKLDPIGTYYGRCKVHGRLVRQSLETKDFKVAKTKVRQWLVDVRGRVHAHEGNMGSLIEEYGRRLQLNVDSRGIRERTRTTKLECLTLIEKVWEELFTTGNINPANYSAGGDQTKHKPAKYLLFRQVRLSSLTPNTLDEWRAAMCKAYSPSRVNGAMTVFGELLKLDGSGFKWLVPRAHLVAAKSLSNGRCEMNFRTHLVTFVSGLGPALITDLMEGKVCKLVGPRGGEQAVWVGVVEDLKVGPVKTAETAGAVQVKKEAQ